MNDGQLATESSINRFDGLAPRDLTPSEKAAVTELALQILKGRVRAGRQFKCPGDVRSYLSLKLADYRHEVFGMILLDTRHRIIELVELFTGTIDGSAAYPRTVAQRVLERNAAGVVLFHNHPSGVGEPSRADEHITRRLIETLSLIDVEVVDHFVIAAEGSISLKERGLI